MRKGVDAASNMSSYAQRLRDGGIDVAIRYYTKFSNWKRLGRQEADALVAAGLKIAVVYQDWNNTVGRFSAAEGSEQAATALSYARDTIRQPANSAIYFAVDFDASAAELSNAIVPYFQAINERFGELDSPYAIGAYGSGLTLRTLLSAGLISYAWLCGSTGYRDYQKFKTSGDWHMLQKLQTTGFGGLQYDPNDISDRFPDCGEFIPQPLTPGLPPVGSPPSHAGVPHIVIARDGLRLRAGPGLGFGTIRTMAYGSPVYVLGSSGDWSLVDLEGDGKADGYMFTTYLLNRTA
jgi:hypothetical protein